MLLEPQGPITLCNIISHILPQHHLGGLRGALSHHFSLLLVVAQLITTNLPPQTHSIIFSFEIPCRLSVLPIQSCMTLYMAVYTPVPYCLEFLRPLYGYGLQVPITVLAL